MQNASPGPRPAVTGESSDLSAPAVLVVSGGDRVSVGLRAALGPTARIDGAESFEHAARVLEGLWYDLVVIDSGIGEGAACGACERLRANRGGPCVLLWSERVTLELATRALRSGAFDLISPEGATGELAGRVRAAAEESRVRRRSAEREARLKRLCHKLDRARREVTGQVGDLCTDLAGAYKDLSEQIGDLAIAGELNGLLRQELEIEGLLRTFLEYLLARVGSTNAGVFLPNSLGEYTLGAYINYDRPKGTAESMLEASAGVIGAAFEHERAVVRLTRPSQIRACMGEAGAWLEDQALLAVGCFDKGGEGGECLGVLCLFRDKRMPFSNETARTVQIAAELFGRQMARVIRVHHRHKPEDLWEDEDEIDRAA
jgi:hypothetical protein